MMRIGDQREIETLISEEVYLFAQYLRAERSVWKARIPDL